MNRDLREFKIDLETTIILGKIAREKELEQSKDIKKPIVVTAIYTKYKNISYLKKLIKKSELSYHSFTKGSPDDDYKYKIFVVQEVV